MSKETRGNTEKRRRQNGKDGAGHQRIRLTRNKGKRPITIDMFGMKTIPIT